MIGKGWRSRRLNVVSRLAYAVGVWSGEVGDQEDVDEVLDAGAVLFLWAVGRCVCVGLLGDVLLYGDHGHFDWLYVGEVQEARDWQSFGGDGWSLVEGDIYGELLEASSGDFGGHAVADGSECFCLVECGGARYIEVEVVVEVDRLRGDESRGRGLLVVGSCEVDVLGCSCPHAESQLKRECSLEHPVSRLRDGEPGEEALEGDALP